MLIAGEELRFGGKVVEPGCPIPVDAGLKNHVLQAHLNKRSILDATQERASEIHAAYLKQKRDAEEQRAKLAIAGLEAQVAEARAEVEAAMSAAAAAESRQAELAGVRRDEEAKAKAQLAELDAELARLAEPRKSNKKS